MCCIDRLRRHGKSGRNRGESGHLCVKAASEWKVGQCIMSVNRHHTVATRRNYRWIRAPVTNFRPPVSDRYWYVLEQILPPQPNINDLQSPSPEGLSCVRTVSGFTPPEKLPSHRQLHQRPCRFERDNLAKDRGFHNEASDRSEMDGSIGRGWMSAIRPEPDIRNGVPRGPLLMRWTVPTRRHLGAKVVVSMNHREIGAVYDRSYHDRS